MYKKVPRRYVVNLPTIQLEIEDHIVAKIDFNFMLR